MAGDTLQFKFDGELVFPPLLAEVGPVTITATNYGTATLTDLGFYIRPATTAGDVDRPATNSPQTDYQDILTWGTRTVAGAAVSGGLIVTLPQDVGPDLTNYVTRNQGSSALNKLVLQDIDPGQTISFTIEFETPPAFSTRRIYIDIGIE
jgi:hypothetical protein